MIIQFSWYGKFWRVPSKLFTSCTASMPYLVTVHWRSQTLAVVLFITFESILNVLTELILDYFSEFVSQENVNWWNFYTGVVLNYFLVNATSWWIFHVSSIFYKVMFPFKARMWKKKEKYIHLFLLVIGTFLKSKTLLVLTWPFLLI